MKKTISLVLSLLMVLSAFSVGITSFAQTIYSQKTYNGRTYTDYNYLYNDAAKAVLPQENASQLLAVLDVYTGYTGKIVNPADVLGDADVLTACQKSTPVITEVLDAVNAYTTSVNHDSITYEVINNNVTTFASEMSNGDVVIAATKKGNFSPNASGDYIPLVNYTGTKFNIMRTTTKGVTYSAYTKTQIKNGISTNSSVKAVKITGVREFNFLYSSLYKASLDANNLTTSNADVSLSNIENAVCSLEIVGDKANIVVLKNNSETESSNFTVDAEIDLVNKTLSFANTKSLEFSKDVTVKNGSLVTTASANTINSTSANSSVEISDVSFSHTVANTVSSDTVVIKSNSADNLLENVDIVLMGRGSSNYRVIGFDATNANSENVVNGLSVTADAYNSLNSGVSGARIVTGSRYKGNSYVDDYTVNISSKNVDSIPSTSSTIWGSVGGIQFQSGSKNARLTNARINVYSDNANSSTGDSWGIKEATSTSFYASGLSVSATSLNYNDRGSAFVSEASGTSEIVSNSNGNVAVFGSFSAIELSGTGNYSINGGDYSAEVHPAYIAANADISNANIYNNQVHPNSQHWGLYFGGQNAKNKIINLRNVEIGSSNLSKNIYPSALTTSSNRNQNTPKQVNLYDCTIHQGEISFFRFNRPTSSNKADTSFNIYEGTTLVKNNGAIVSSQELNAGLSTWLTTNHYDNSTGKYTTNIGNDYVWGTESANVDETTGTINSVYLNAGAGVYDFR